MQVVRKIGIRFAALAFAGAVGAHAVSAQEPADNFRILAAAPGNVKKLDTKSKESKDRGVVVYVMRGWLDVFSTGMDDLADKMKRRGINAIAMSHSDHLVVAQQIIDRHKQGIKERPVLIGHSLGANATAAMAAELGKAGIHVPLIVMFDPTVVQHVPANVGRAVNYYQSNNGWGVKVETARGFKGKLENVDLYKEELGHTGIDKSPRLHLQAMSFVQGLRGVRDPEIQEAINRPRPKLETAGEMKHSAPPASAEHKGEAKVEAKAEAKTEAKSAAPVAAASTPSSGETKTPSAPASGEAKPASDKPAEKPAATGQPDGLFSEIKRPTL